MKILDYVEKIGIWGERISAVGAWIASSVKSFPKQVFLPRKSD